MVNVRKIREIEVFNPLPKYFKKMKIAIMEYNDVEISVMSKPNNFFNPVVFIIGVEITSDNTKCVSTVSTGNVRLLTVSRLPHKFLAISDFYGITWRESPNSFCDKVPVLTSVFAQTQHWLVVPRVAHLPTIYTDSICQNFV